MNEDTGLLEGEKLEAAKREFEAKGFVVMGDFEDNGRRYVLYHMNANAPSFYVTGDVYDWESGLRYDLALEYIVKDYFITKEVEMKIKTILKGSRV